MSTLRRAFGWTPLVRYIKRVERGSQIQRDRVNKAEPNRDGLRFLSQMFEDNHISAKVAAYLGGRQ